MADAFTTDLEAMTSISESLNPTAGQPDLGVYMSAPAPTSDRLRPMLRSALQSIVGDENFLDDSGTRNEYSKSTLPKSTYSAAIVRPKSAEQVQQIVRKLGEFGVQWHCFSRGKNWGYGDRCAATDGQVLIDLGRMNRIVEINEELAYAVIEPGVSQGELAGELLKRGSRLMLDVTGAGPDASIVGNILQRGFGHTPYGDRFSQSCNYQVVLPNGDVTHTGFGDIDASPVGHVYPYGLGPNVQGMMPQSKNGIVTRMTIWLMPRPEAIDGFGFKTDDDATFSQIVDCIGRLRQAGVIDSVVHLANDLRVASSQPIMQSIQSGDGPLTAEQRQHIRKELKIERWNGLGGLYGPRYLVDAKRDEIKRTLGKYCKVRFFKQWQVNLLKTAAEKAPDWRIANRFKNFVHTISDVNDLLCGVPNSNHLEGAFYRNRPESGEVTDAGLIWTAPVIPCRGDDALTLVKTMEPIANQYGFDLPITISPVVPRAAVCITNISFDKRSKSQAANATDCHMQLKQAIGEKGYPSYRASIVAKR
ncbi:FAD-dependent oxidoreductase [Stieleria sp. JC731]|nr:FAD-dependent oxidoreductase [Stieleria sp. JC731]